MKLVLRLGLAFAPAVLALLTLNSQLSTLHAQGTAFTYQGQLQNNGVPASGIYNLQFTLYTNCTGGTAVAGPVTNCDVIVANGLFTVTIDFGYGLFAGTNYWLQIGVETNGVNSFTTLSPPQQLTPVPYAIFAESSSNLLGTLPASQLITSVGFENFFVGPSGNSTTTGSYNTASGNSALGADTIGSDNTADGAEALANNMSGYFNTANGYQALLQNNSGSDNTANGFWALYDNYYGSDNTADGAEALYQLGNGIAGGTNNIALGYKAGYNLNGNQSSNIDIGNEGFSTDTNIIRIGCSQSQTYIAGVINGNGGGLTNVSASQLTSIGMSLDNFYVGPSGDAPSGAAAYNTAIGVGALTNNTSGLYNTANGYQALTDNTSGSGNIADGAQALFENTIGSDNVAIGNSALAGNNIGSDNTAIGDLALIQNTAGSNNIALGFNAGYDLDGNESSNIDIGNPGLNTDNSIIRIGTSQTATYLVGNVYTPSGTVEMGSDRNAKEDFMPLNPQTVLAKVAGLPITEWNYKTTKNMEHIGPMAQDFHAAFGLNGADDKHISVVDEGGVALAAIQGLNEKVEARSQDSEARMQKLEAENTDLKAQNDLLAQRLNELEETVKTLAERN